MDDFEKACSEYDPGDYWTDHENVINFERDAKVATVTFCQGRYITKIKKLAERFPDQVEICSEKNGSIIAHIPVNAIKISLSEPKVMTDEEKKILTERLKLAREQKADS